jgi:hypothetical protein
MENRTSEIDKQDKQTKPNWERPTVKELDINALTLVGSTGVGLDNVIYS